MEKKKKAIKIIRNILIVVMALACILVILKIAPNYKNDDVKDRTNLVLNSSNITRRVKQDGSYFYSDVYVDDKGVVYLSMEDVENFFDRYITIDKKYNQLITTSTNKIATIELGKNEMYVNSSKTELYGTVVEKDGKYYLPFSEMGNIYNTKTTYIKDTNTVVIESLDKELKKGILNKNVSVKVKNKTLSRTVDKAKKGDSVVIIAEENGWTKVRTDNGKIGYVSSKAIENIRTERENMVSKKQIEGKVNLVWDYFSESASAPNRQGETIKGSNVVSPAFFALTRKGQGDIEENVGQKGKDYIEWAHSNGYKVWPIMSNNSMLETTSEIMNDYKLREKLINNIVAKVVEYKLDGINIDFENMKQEDKNLFSRFIIELEPRLQEIGAVLSVDVTAPDGGETWSLCYDRDVLGHVSDYLIFMAYDQHGTSSKEAGSVAAYNWVKANISKFLGQEGVDKEKLILGIPLYTRLWKEKEGEVTSSVYSMKRAESALPQGIEKKWDEETKQNYVEYEEVSGTICKMWIEDLESIKAKLSLIQEYDLMGSAFWQKDMEVPEVWDLLAEMIK